jgi:hypothetical protein
MTLNDPNEAQAVIAELEAQRNALGSRACNLALDVARLKAALAAKEAECAKLRSAAHEADRAASPDWDAKNGE